MEAAEISHPSRPKHLSKLHGLTTAWSVWSSDPQEELLQHSRYIRDFLSPILASQPELPAVDLALMSSVLSRIGAVEMTIDLLRKTRIEKALMLVVKEAEECWPTALVSYFLFIHCEHLVFLEFDSISQEMFRWKRIPKTSKLMGKCQ